MSVAVIFPGQGTQEPGMATPWRDHPAWHVIDEAEAALGEKVGFLVTEATAEDLSRTREAQLAVLLTSLVVWEAMQPLPEVPVAFAGHSLGQVTALDRRRRAAARGRCALRRPSGRAHAGRRRPRIPAAWPRCWAPPSNRPTRPAPPHPTPAGSPTTTPPGRS